MRITEKSILHAMAMMRLHHSEAEFQRIPMEAETHILNLVRQGRYQDIHISGFEKIEGNIGRMAESQIMQYLFLAAAAIALQSRAAIDGGAVADDVFDLSDALLQVLSTCKTKEEICTVYQLSPSMFAKLVADQRVMEPCLTIEKVQNYIQRNISQKITLTDIADYVSLTPNYLSNLFSAQMNMPIHQYIQREKINTACEMLAHSIRSISDISLHMGYQSQSNFAVVFKKWKGMTPTEYRRQHYREVY